MPPPTKIVVAGISTVTVLPLYVIVGILLGGKLSVKRKAPHMDGLVSVNTWCVVGPPTHTEVSVT